VIRFAHIWPLFLLIIPLAIVIFKLKTGRSSPFPDKLSTILRLVAITFVILSLSAPQMLSWVESHYVYFVVDISKSVHPNQDQSQLVQQINQLAVPQENTQYGLIAFGKDSFVEAPFAATLRISEILSNVGTDGTDLESALDLALATFPQEGKKTVVLLSDGQVSEGEVSETLSRAKREGVEIYSIPQYAPGSEFLIQTLQAPQEVAVDLPFNFQNVIYAERPATGTLHLFKNEELIRSEDISLQAGLNYILHNDELGEAGVYEYRTELVIDGDALVENNSYRALVESVGDPRILVVESEDQVGDSVLANLLNNSGYEFTRTTLADLAPTASSLLSYRAVILNDVPLKEVTYRQIEHLENYVRDMGGGLFLVQGRNAVEEFYDREFERILPVRYEGPEEIQRPALALVMLLDRSGSMGESAGEYLKIDLLKQAALEAVDKIDPKNMVGVIGFDSRYEWLVELQTIEGREASISESINKLFPNGGTDIYQALRDAVIELQKVDARVKHILVFSDGKVSQQDRDFESIFDDITQSTISASSIAIGSQADINFLWQLADVGSGEKYPVVDARDLPRITLEEMVRLERARWIKGPLDVEAGPFAYELQSVEAGAVPDVDGYVLTFEKPAGQTLLQVRSSPSHRDPLVSHWRFGLGEVYVLNTSFEGEGLERWKTWEDLSSLTAEILGQVYSESSLQPSELTVWTEYVNSELKVHVEAERDGQWLDLLEFDGQLNSPEGASIPLEIEQTGPGQYEAVATDLHEGVYLLNLGEESIGSVKDAIHVPYAAEYQRIGVNDRFLEQIANLTGGQYLENPARLQEHIEGRTQTYRDIWQVLVVLSLIFFMADLIARKLPTPSA